MRAPVACYAVVAPPHQGKTYALRTLAERLREVGVLVVGVLQPALGERAGVPGYVVESLATGDRQELARPRAGGRGFEFLGSGFRLAAEELCRPGPVLLVDEFGWLEAAGRGHAPALARAIAVPGRLAVVLAVRQESLPALRRWLPGVTCWPLPPRDQLAARLEAWVALLVEVIS